MNRFKWVPFPGSRHHLFDRKSGELLDVVHSPRVGVHVVSSTRMVYERLFDAQVAAEKAANGG